MNPRTLGFLQCPSCRGALSLSARTVNASGEVLDGSLTCAGCGRSFRIRDGLPDFVLPECLGTTNRFSRALYNAYAPLYDRLEFALAKLSGFTEPELRKAIADYLELRPGHLVLEVCVGTGGNLPYIRARTGAPIVGLDLSEEMLRECARKVRRLGLKDAHLFLGCAERLPFRSGVFDRVLIGGGITYFSDPGSALREARRVVKPGGLVVVFEQLTLLEHLLGRARVPLKLIPEGLRPTGLRWLFNRRFYLLKLLAKP